MIIHPNSWWPSSLHLLIVDHESNMILDEFESISTSSSSSSSTEICSIVRFNRMFVGWPSSSSSIESPFSLSESSSTTHIGLLSKFLDSLIISSCMPNQCFCT
ncbi:hypothetical protein DERP_002567 [Dermatophagoides pteronyssinus]|uniref:Uncharacterized protein n=1 Tax=Dermatophagoides pteronyssinus TaxID=6956 RepID=A0ABQ8JI34_DERPT|nr:hypothetical protein DERP_002567 [Dermatophagoides pteronyssinus]